MNNFSQVKFLISVRNQKEKSIYSISVDINIQPPKLVKTIQNKPIQRYCINDYYSSNNALCEIEIQFTNCKINSVKEISLLIHVVILV